MTHMSKGLLVSMEFNHRPVVFLCLLSASCSPTHQLVYRAICVCVMLTHSPACIPRYLCLRHAHPLTSVYTVLFVSASCSPTSLYTALFVSASCSPTHQLVYRAICVCVMLTHSPACIPCYLCMRHAHPLTSLYTVLFVYASCSPTHHRQRAVRRRQRFVANARPR
jgi:hypothetical protein